MWNVITILAKLDLKHAYQYDQKTKFVRLHCYIDSLYVFNKCMPIGCHVSCSAFETFSTILHWYTSHVSGLHTLCHYLDDYVMIGRPDTAECEQLMQSFVDVCQYLGVEIAHDKTEGPSTSVTYLGLVIDSELMEVRAPVEKIDRAKGQIISLLHKQKVTLQVFSSVIGLLAFLCRAIPTGRAFLRRMYDATKGITCKHHKVTLTKVVKCDLSTWLDFLTHHNGVSTIITTDWQSTADFHLYTDAAGSSHLGYGIYFDGQWAQGKFPKHWENYNITLKEIFPICAALIMWSTSFANKKIIFNVDNQAALHILSNYTSHCPHIMQLVRVFVKTCMQFNILTKFQYVSTKSNCIADSLSRFDQVKFRSLAPMASDVPTPVPAFLFDIC